MRRSCGEAGVIGVERAAGGKTGRSIGSNAVVMVGSLGGSTCRYLFEQVISCMFSSLVVKLHFISKLAEQALEGTVQ